MNGTPGEENQSARSPREDLLQRLQAQPATGEPRGWDRDSLYDEGEEDARVIQETRHLVSIPGIRASILEGMATPIEDLSDQPGW